MTHDDLINRPPGLTCRIADGILVVDGQGGVFLSSLTTLPDSVTFSNGGYVHLPSLTTLPDNVTFSNGGNVFLSSLTTLPDSVTFSNGGNVFLSSLTTLPDSVTFSNGGYVHLPSLTSEAQTYRGQAIRLRIVDGLTMLIERDRQKDGMTISKARYFGGGDLDKLNPCWIASNGAVHAHGATIDEALSDLRFKLAECDFDRDELIAEIMARGTVRFEDFRLLTGACSEGLRHGMEQAGLDPEARELPLPVVMAAVHGPYGATFKAAFSGMAA